MCTECLYWWKWSVCEWIPLLLRIHTLTARSPTYHLFAIDCLFSRNLARNTTGLNGSNAVAFVAITIATYIELSIPIATSDRKEWEPKTISKNLMLSFIRLSIHSFENVRKTSIESYYYSQVGWPKNLIHSMFIVYSISLSRHIFSWFASIIA